MMLRERIQTLLNFCSPAADPTEWKEQLVTVGKTVHWNAETAERNTQEKAERLSSGVRIGCVQDFIYPSCDADLGY